MKKLIECVPNFSEGRDMAVIKEITNAIEGVEGVKLLNVDPGAATNRTVVTFIGEPEAVVEAAFRAVKRASEVIDMRNHSGEHPRIGATDVLPLVPVAGVTMGEAAAMARALAERVGSELDIPVYCYEAAAFCEKRRNLAVCREGEYEGLQKKLENPEWKPDFGASSYSESVARTGASVIGARDFLVAVNFNLNTTSTRRANAVAFDVREKGRPKREGGLPNGKPLKDENGNVVTLPGTLPGTKAIGWFIEEYGVAQVSMNITDTSKTSLHRAFEETEAKAAFRGLRVTGAEIVGLIPKKVIIDAGLHFLHKQQRSGGVSEAEIIKIAVKSMGLDELRPFDPKEKVIEYLIEPQEPKLVNLTAEAFAEETASESAAPGGGSVSAYMGTLGVALGVMVANLSAHKAGWDDRWHFFADVAERGHAIMTDLKHLVDEDTAAFNVIMAVFAMPKGTDEEKKARSLALQNATLYATEVPLRTIKTAFMAFDIVREMADKGNPSSVSDAGVGAIALRGAIMGAALNVKINASGLKDRAMADAMVAEAEEYVAKAARAESEILNIVTSKIK